MSFRAAHESAAAFRSPDVTLPSKNPTTPPTDDNAGGGEPAAGEPGADDAALLASLKKRGFDITSLEDLRKPAAPAAAAPAETPEQAAAKAEEKRKKVYEKFIANGGTEAEYTAINETLKKDELELAKVSIIDELKAEGFSDEEAEHVFKQRYFVADDGDDFYTEKHKSFATNRLKKRGERAKAEAAEKIAEAEAALQTEEIAAQRFAAWEPAVEEAVKGIDKAVSFEIPVKDGDPIKITYDLKDEDLQEIKDAVKDPRELRKALYNDDNTTNLKGIIELFKWAKLGKKMAVSAYSSGESATVEHFRSVLPNSPFFGSQGGSGITTSNLTEQQKKEVNKVNGLFNRPRMV